MNKWENRKMTWEKDLKNSKFRRVKQWRGNPDFDREILQTRDLSALRQLSRKYHNEIIAFSREHDISVEDNFTILQSMKRNYKMINEEISERDADINASPTYYGRDNTSFFTETGIIWDHQTDSISCTVEFNDDETEIIKRNEDGDVIEVETIECDKVDEQKEKKKSLKDIYKDWEY